MVSGVPRAVRWLENENGYLVYLDQTRLPSRELHVACHDPKHLIAALKSLAIRGAPLLGIAGAYGVCLAAKQIREKDPVKFFASLISKSRKIYSARPTAVNLAWGAKRTLAAASNGLTPSDMRRLALAEAKKIHSEDAAMCASIGSHGLKLVRPGAGILTVCNAGALATGGVGTALAPLYAAKAEGRKFTVFACETRPLLQGARLTAWELTKAHIRCELICDSMAGFVMAAGLIDVVITGADRIAMNGDFANKIGTYPLAILANAHDIPFFVAAPASTFDPEARDGGDIKVEFRPKEEVLGFAGRRVAPKGMRAINPAFDIVPARLVSAFITDRGFVNPPFAESIDAILE